MATFNVKELATQIDFSSVDINIEDSLKVILLDNEAPDIKNLVDKIKKALENTDNALEQTVNIEGS